jgi:hypothetical protein
MPPIRMDDARETAERYPRSVDPTRYMIAAETTSRRAQADRSGNDQTLWTEGMGVEEIHNHIFNHFRR